MAIYLTHKYGQRFYGPEPDLPSFDAKKFLAYSVDYRTVHLTWDPPVGQFEGFRLVTNKFGLPQSEDDGDILMDTAVPDVGYDDTDVKPGTFAYYAVFLKISGIWSLAGYTSCLHIADLRSTPWLWDRLPTHYKLLRGNHLTLQADENLDLARMVAVWGWGLDRVRTAMRASWSAAHIDTTHEAVVDLISAQIGLPSYPGLTGLRRRSLARDGAALGADKGTTTTMQAVARTTSGWDVTLRPTANLMGSYDRSGVRNPLPLEWDPSVHYAIGARVHFYGVSYKCVTAAYGYEQCPDGEGATNTWWQRLATVEAATAARDTASRSQHGWQGISFTAGQPDTKAETRLALGIPSPGDTTIDTNAITVHNTHSSALNTAARCLPAVNSTTPDQLTVITHGIPLPEAADWDATTAYTVGDLVIRHGRLWYAYRPPLVGISPSTATDRWRVVGTDTRLRLCLSAYTHQPHTDNTKPANPAQMYIEWYDDRGKFLSREFGAATDTRILDTFNTYSGSSVAALGGRTTEYGAKTWVDQVAGFRRDSYVYGAIRPDVPGNRAMSTINYGSASATVAATFSTAAPAGQTQALILRYASTTSYLRATRTALQTVSGATVTTLATYSAPIADGDRLTVAVNGNNYTILRNGVSVGTASSTFNNTATIFGLAVE